MLAFTRYTNPMDSRANEFGFGYGDQASSPLSNGLVFKAFYAPIVSKVPPRRKSGSNKKVRFNESVRVRMFHKECDETDEIDNSRIDIKNVAQESDAVSEEGDNESDEVSLSTSPVLGHFQRYSSPPPASRKVFRNPVPSERVKTFENPSVHLIRCR